MRILPLFCLLAVLAANASFSQEATSIQDRARTPPRRMPYMQLPVHLAPSRVVREGTIVVVYVVSGIKRGAKTGDKVRLGLDRDLWAGDVLIAEQGAPVEGTIMDGSHTRWIRRGAKVAIELSGLQMANGNSLPLRATAESHASLGPTGKGPAGSGDIAPMECPLCVVVSASASLVPAVSLATVQGGKHMKSKTVVPTWVDHDVTLEVASFDPFQPKARNTGAKVQVVRGRYGYAYDRDLYCNGNPLAHLSTKQRFDLDLQPGWYRFAINPEKQFLELFLAPGSITKLITDYERIYIVNNLEEEGKLVSPRRKFVPDRAANTSSFFAGPTGEDEYLQSAHPVDSQNIYSRECPPLAREVRAP